MIALHLIGRDAGQREQPDHQGHRQRNTGQTVERQQVVGRDQNDRGHRGSEQSDGDEPTALRLGRGLDGWCSAHVAPRRARSLVRDAWVGGAVPALPCPWRAGHGGGLGCGHPQHPHPVDQESEQRERRSDLRRDREGVQHPLPNSPAYRRRPPPKTLQICRSRRGTDRAQRRQDRADRHEERTGPSGPPVRAVRRPAHPKIVAVTRTHRRHAQTGPLNPVAATFPRRCIE